MCYAASAVTGGDGVWQCGTRVSSSGCVLFFFFSSRRRHTIFDCDWSSDVCSSDLGSSVGGAGRLGGRHARGARHRGLAGDPRERRPMSEAVVELRDVFCVHRTNEGDRKSTRLNSSHSQISYAVFCLKKKNTTRNTDPTTHPEILPQIPSIK